MTYIYLDESGDLGFSQKSSKYFIICCVKVDDEEINKRFCRIVKKIRTCSLKKRYKRISELKFSNSSERIRTLFLKKAAELEIKIFALVIQKEYTYPNLRDNIPILYSYLSKILFEKAMFKLDSSPLIICMDRVLTTEQQGNFRTYILTQFLDKTKGLPNFEIIHDNSQNNSGLQVTDFISGSFGYKYNTAKNARDSEIYTSIIKKRIIVEKSNLFRKK